MHDQIKTLSRLIDRWKYYNEAPKLEDLEELHEEISDANDTCHDDCYSHDDALEISSDRINELEQEIRDLKASKPKRARKKKVAINFETLEETRRRVSNEFASCECEESRCSHWRKVETAEMWLRRAKELAS